MRIYIETYAIRHPYVGVGEFCLNLGHHLALQASALRQKHGIELCFIVPQGQKGVFGREVGYLSFPANIRQLSRLLFTHHIDLLHLTHQHCAFVQFPRVDRQLLTIHDVNFMYEKQGAKLSKYTHRLDRMLLRSDHVSYISNFAKADTERHFPVSVPSRVIYNGVRQLAAAHHDAGNDFMAKCPPQPFLLHLSSLRPKKNVHLLIDMMLHLPQEQLVIAGDWHGAYGKELLRRIETLGLHNVTALPNVSTAEKAWLYAHCKAFLFPSACEGFGLPPVEAMQFGKPVFLSTKTSLPEIGGAQAYYWPQLEPQAMAATVRQKLTAFTPAEAAALQAHAAQFTWERCASAYIQYYLDILGTDKKN